MSFKGKPWMWGIKEREKWKLSGLRHRKDGAATPWDGQAGGEEGVGKDQEFGFRRVFFYF